MRRYFSLYLLTILSLTLSLHATTPPLEVYDKPFDDPFLNPQAAQKTSPSAPPFSYTASEPDFWQRIQEMLSDTKTKDHSIFNQIKVTLQQTEDGSPSQTEAIVALAQFFERQKLYYGAYILYAQAAERLIGSSVSELALYKMGKLLSRHPMDDLEIERFINRREYMGLHPEVQSFVSYYQYRHNKRLGLEKWASDQLKLIQPNSHWQHLLTFSEALGLVHSDRLEDARRGFAELNENADLELWLKNSARLQLARLSFEEGKWQEANSLYYALNHLPLREQGRVLLERAWSLYYQKDYAASLGALKSLENPYFEPSVNFEKYILEMIIYRELCHYESVQQTAKLFSFRFGNALEQIRQRKPLRLDGTLFNMATMSQNLQPRANLIHQIRDEGQRLSQTSWTSVPQVQALIKIYNQRDQFLQEELNKQIELRAREIALQLLDANEQVTFIEYVSSIDSFRTNRRQPASQNYSLKTISRTSFKQIYWPVYNEHWWDEINDYTALISNRCEEK